MFWRIYFKGYLEQRPSIWQDYCAGRDAALTKVADNAGLAKAYTEATQGTTGIAAFDQWARELVQYGYLHNHARMWFASIWIFTLKLDWQLGADFFLRHLIDADAASNTLSWRWVAGLHTKGKTYLARTDNIERYTAKRPDGPLSAYGMAEEATALEEHRDHPRQSLELPTGQLPDQPYALLLHDEGASHVPLGLTHAPELIIAAARPDARAPQAVGEPASSFAQGAVSQGAAAAAQAYGCPLAEWHPEAKLADILAEAQTGAIATPYLPTGWTHDALWPELASFAETGALTQLLSDLDRATWPHARAGFFKVKKAIPDLLDQFAFQAAA